MRQKVFNTALLLALQAAVAFTQTPESFFPHHVGDRWDYEQWWCGNRTIYSLVITRDSIGNDSSYSIFYNNEPYPRYRIDTLYNVFWYPTYPALNYLRYKLGADSGQVWQLQPPNPGGWAWVAEVESTYVFSQPTVVKVYRYGPGHPDSTTAYLEEDQLASRFGLIYHWQEPNDIIILRGCVINGDTFGVLVSTPIFEEPILPRELCLWQNYPNPFNPTTTFKFELPREAVVSIRVYDLLSRQIALVAEGKFPAGIHRVTWDATGFPSGPYFIRLVTPYGTQTKKAILLR